MPFVTAKDGTEIYYKDWGRDSLSSSPTAGLSPPIRGTRS